MYCQRDFSTSGVALNTREGCEFELEQKAPGVQVMMVNLHVCIVHVIFQLLVLRPRPNGQYME